MSAWDGVVSRCRRSYDSGLARQANGGAMKNQRVAEIARLLDVNGRHRYGLTSINQIQHALQAALQAERNGDPDALVTVALLHDIGHMVHDLGENPAAEGVDDKHEEVGHAYLCDLFGPAVSEPVRLHVAAKRYLCGKEADYFARLSEDSVLSLSLQDGPMSADEIAAFETLPYWREAVKLRRYDDGAKVQGLETPDVWHFLPVVERSLLA
jgi:phosphonate degradation associated HDIG domain protein